MLNRIRFQATFLTLISILLMLSGCAEIKMPEPYVRIVSYGPHSSATHKLKSVRVVLANNQTTSMKIVKLARNSESIINASDKLDTQQYLNEIRKSLVAITKERLYRSGVVEGDEAILELALTEGYYDVNLRSGNVVVKATIKRPSTAQEMWNVSILTYSPEKANHEVLLNNFAFKLVSELKAEGWL